MHSKLIYNTLSQHLFLFAESLVWNWVHRICCGSEKFWIGINTCVLNMYMILLPMDDACELISIP